MSAAPLHVGLNLVYLVPGEIGGMEVYARELIPALLEERPDLRLTAFINREAAEAGGGPWGTDIPAVTVPVRARNRIEWVRGEQQLLPPRAAAAGVDLVHSLASTAPAWGRFGRVVTIHDVTYRVFWRSHGLRAAGMHVLVPLAARRSDRVIAVSANTRDDLVRMLHVPRAKVDVVHNAASPRVTGQVPSEAELRERHGLGDRQVLLAMSAKRPHKNLVRLLDALALIPPDRRPVLVIPGYPTPHEEELREHSRSLGLDPDVRFLGWIEPPEAEGLWALAAASVFPSLYEGFGIPVIEAMLRGVPVACSARGSLAEVAGGAALHFDPERPEEIAAAVRRMLEDGALAAGLRERGLKRAKEFSWRRTARETLMSYERAIETAVAAGRVPAGR